jgi:hypothetical protein
MKLNLFLILLLVITLQAYAGNTMVKFAPSDLPNQEDITVLDTDKLEELRNSDDYNYNEKEELSNWWTDFKEWLWLQVKKIFGEDTDPDSFIFGLIGLLPYLVPAIAIIIIVWLILKTNPGSQVMRQHNTSKVILTEEEELLMQRNLNKLAEEAIKNKELRLAVRYLYLNCIKRLDMKRIIRYANEKTNYEYIKEIKFSEVSQQFKSLTLTYEQIWYGQMVFDEIYFQKYKGKYDHFQSLLDQKQYAKA